MSNKWQVKAFQWEEKDQELNKDKKTKHHVRKLVVLAVNLSWQAAKELRNKYYAIDAMIFTYKEPELKVIKLS